MKRIRLTHGYEALVDDADYPVVSRYSWYVVRKKKHVYASSRIGGRIVKLHRFILGLSASTPWVDHANGNGLDNQRANLRLCTHAQNTCGVRRSNNKTGYVGVHWEKQTGRYRAMLAKRGLGRFSTVEEAAKAYDAAALVRYGDFARTNFPSI